MSTDDNDNAYIVMRVIKTAHDTSIAIPMGVFADTDSAELFVLKMRTEVNNVMELLATGPDGQVIPDMTIGTFVGGLGIAGIQHRIQGPVKITRGGQIVAPPSQSLIIPGR